MLLKKKNEGKSAALRRESLGHYRNAALAYSEVEMISVKTAELAGAQSQDLSETLKAAEENIKKAQEYGASVSQLEKPQEDLKKAKEAYAQERYSETGKILESLRTSLEELITLLEPEYARKLLEEAKTAVNKAEEHYKRMPRRVNCPTKKMP